MTSHSLWRGAVEIFRVEATGFIPILDDYVQEVPV